MDQTRPLFIYFRPFLNTMTNMAHNMTTKGFELGTAVW